MRKLAFSLIELLIVIILMGVISYLVVKLPSYTVSYSLTDLRNKLSPDGYLIVYDNNEINSSKKVKFECSNPVTYEYIDGIFKQKVFSKDIVFEYRVKRGVGESFILKCGSEYYVFKPFFIKKFNSLQKAENLYVYKGFEPKEGSYY